MAQLTYEDYAELPEGRYEIIDGALYLQASPAPRHQEIVLNLLMHLHPYLKQHGNGKVFQARIDVLLSEHDIVEPDIIVIKSERASIAGEKNIQGVPNIVIEVLSEETRRMDEVTKRQLYERSGVEYWIVESAIEQVWIYRGGASERVEKTITTPLLPGFSLDIHEVFAT